MKVNKQGNGEEKGHSEVGFVAQLISVHIRVKLWRQKFSPQGQKLEIFKN